MTNSAKTALALALAIVGGIAAGLRCDASVKVESSSHFTPRSAAYTVKTYTEGSDPFDAPTQPVSPYADTEVSTNVVINRADISYSDLHFAFAGTPTNSLELAFGTDVNTNGVLEAEEIASRFGWRSGRYFIENAESGEVLDGAASNSSQSFSIDLHLEVRYGSQQVRSMTVSGVDAAAFGAVVSNAPPTWIWRREWNMMRATRRGTELPSDWIEYNASHRGFAIRLR